MKTLRFLFILTFCSVPAIAQYNPWWQWAKADASAAMSVTNGGSVLAVKNGKAFWGRQTVIRRFDAQNNAQGTWSLAEYDSTGRGLNATVIAGKVELLDVQADPGGNWYVLGRFYDSVIFANGTILTRLNPATSPDADHFIARFNASTMTMTWVKLLGPLRTVSARTFTLDNTRLYVACDSLDNTVIRGMAFSNGDATTLFVQKGGTVTNSIQVDGFGNLYLTGSCAIGTIDFNGATETAPPPDAFAYVVKYNISGAHQWHYWFRNLDCAAYKVTLYKNSILYFSGTPRDSLRLGTGPLVLRSPGGGYAAARLNPANGAVVWMRILDTLGGGGGATGKPYHAAVTPDSALALFLQGSGYINWGDTFTTDLQGVRTAAVLASISATDSVRWTRTVYSDVTTNARVAAEGDAVWVCGLAYSTGSYVALDTLHLPVPPLSYTPYLARLRLTRPPVIKQGVGGPLATTTLVAPVPAHSGLRIAGLPGGSALLMDVTGRIVQRLEIGKGMTTAIMDVASLPRGAYLLELRGTDGSKDVRRVVLE